MLRRVVLFDASTVLTNIETLRFQASFQAVIERSSSKIELPEIGVHRKTIKPRTAFS